MIVKHMACQIKARLMKDRHQSSYVSEEDARHDVLEKNDEYGNSSLPNLPFGAN